ncbi:MAG: hydroxyethylthiazole kinase [Clostridiales bacterium]|nr:hydroxyethylthiazole kinase [Clostridiales bacterium]
MIEQLLEKVRREKPLIHHITNQVTINDCANATLCIGALPVMTHAVDEVEEMAAASGALVLNIGTPTPDQIDAMVAAGKKANQLNIPVILDPVGLGATNLRNDTVKMILDNVHISVIKGNTGEISILAGRGGTVKGVESIGRYDNIETSCHDIAKAYGCTVVVTGAADMIADSNRTLMVKNGDAMMGRVVGTGCMAASMLGCFAAVESDHVQSSAAAMACFGIAGQLAAKRSDIKGPGTFKAALMDELYNLDTASIEQYLNIEEVVTI